MKLFLLYFDVDGTEHLNIVKIKIKYKAKRCGESAERPRKNVKPRRNPISSNKISNTMDLIALKLFN